MKVINYSKRYLSFSGLLISLSLLSLAIFGLRLSIDFTGGTVFQISYDESLNQSQAKEELQDVLIKNNVDVQSLLSVDTGFVKNVLEVKTTEITSEDLDIILFDLNSLHGADGLSEIDFPYSVLSFETVGASFGVETFKKSLIALLVAFGVILVYIAYAFKEVPAPYSSLSFGIGALLAMFHDVIITFGIFAFLGKYAGVEIDILFVTALLTVIGYSVNDSIVVFDRIRENLIKHKRKRDFAELIDMSISQTLRRSLGTSFTVLVVLFCLFVYGGQSTRFFVLAMMVGVVSGTYSSIFVASPLVYLRELDRK